MTTPGPSVSGQPTPKIVSGEYDDAAAQHDALVRAAEQARAENARLRQERNEARELAAQANAVCSRTLESQHDAWQAKLVAVEAERNAATLLVRTAQAQRDTAARCEEEAINALDRLRERLEQIVKVWTPWPGSASRELLAELRRAIEDRPPDHGDLARSAKRALAATAPQTAPSEPDETRADALLLLYDTVGAAPWIEPEVVAETIREMARKLAELQAAPTPADPGPDVDAFVNTPAGRAWLAGAAGREALRPAPTENTREQILARLAQPTPADQGAALIAATEAELDEYTEGHLCAQAWREAAHTLAAALDRRADQGVVRETGEAGDFVRLAFGLRQRSITWDGDVIQAALHTIDDLRAARTAGDEHLQARPSCGCADADRTYDEMETHLVEQLAEARREAERLRGEIGKVADDFGVKAVRLTGTTDPLDRVAFALCEDVAERLRALASTGGSDTTGGAS